METFFRYGNKIRGFRYKKRPLFYYVIMSLCHSEIGAGCSCTGGTVRSRNGGTSRTGIIILRQYRFQVLPE